MKRVMRQCGRGNSQAAPRVGKADVARQEKTQPAAEVDGAQDSNWKEMARSGANDEEGDAAMREKDQPAARVDDTEEARREKARPAAKTDEENMPKDEKDVDPSVV